MIMAGTDGIYIPRNDARRGIRVYNYTQTMAIGGTTKDGQQISGFYDIPLYGLSIDDRIDIFRYSSPVFGCITTRMHKIAGYKWKVNSDKSDEERIVDALRAMKDIYDEYKAMDDLKGATIRAVVSGQIRERLRDCLPDLSNFNTSLVRWYRNIKGTNQDRAREVEDWLSEPNLEDKWEDFVKKWVFDLHVHGNSAIYKESLDGRLENFYCLAGGTIFPLRGKYVGGYNAYAQVAEGMQIQIYFTDEISHTVFVPSTATPYGICPLDALVNKVAEGLLFDKLMAEQADGTKPPEKLLVFGENSPFGDMGADLKIPMNKDEQQKIETAVNEYRKGAIKVLTGHGTPLMVDMTRENTMSVQLERQRMIREEVGMVYNMSNMEMNLTGADDTSGRSTSEAQERIEFGKGTLPILTTFQNRINKDIIPYRFGTGYNFEFVAGKDEMSEMQLYALMLQTGLYSVNEIRSNRLNEMPFKGDQYNQPSGQQPADAGSSEMNPQYMKQI